MDGTTFSVAMPEGAPVAALKREIGVLREVPCFTMELFVKDVEEPLDDEKPLHAVDRAPLFLLLKPASDRLALEALFKSTGGADWTEKEGWMMGAELGDWHGVTVDAEGRVIKLELRDNGLAGPLPSDMQQLSALELLDLADNALTGPIPAELGQLGGLTELSLSFNQLSGPIPAELGQLGALTELSLGDQLGCNKLSGPVPAELGQLAALRFLNLDGNQLSGPIPAELGQLAALEYLFLDGNQQLTGQEALRDYMEEHNPDCVIQL
jgi:Leucine-rich repeat (LRR) protein